MTDCVINPLQDKNFSFICNYFQRLLLFISNIGIFIFDLSYHFFFIEFYTIVSVYVLTQQRGISGAATTGLGQPKVSFKFHYLL